MSWKVEQRKNCLACEKLIDRTLNKRLRSYCSKECRTKFLQERTNRRYVDSGLSKQWQREKYDELSKFERPGTVQCDICSGWYRRVARHVSQRHEMTAREYKTEHGYAKGKGLISQESREHMREMTLENGTVSNLLSEAAKAHRYTKGDPRAAERSNPWGNKGAPRPNINE